MSRPTTLALALALAIAVVTASCSGSDDAATTRRSTTTDAARSSTPAGPSDDTAGDDAPTAYAAAAGQVASAPAVPSEGCGTSPVRQVTKDKRTLPGSDRWYYVTTPPEHDGTTPLPLVLDFHGLAEGADIHTLFSAYPDYAQSHGFVVATPNGTGEPVAWQVGTDRTTNPDLIYTDEVLDRIEADLCIDTARVYATGLSNGAFLSSVLACTMADRIVAVAPVAGLIHPDDCAPSRPVPVLAFHGTADPILLFNGEIGTRLGSVLEQTSGEAPVETPATTEAELPEADLDGEGFPANAAAWAQTDGCTGEPTDTVVTPSVTQRSWDCPPAAPVVFDIIDGGGHSWPGSEFGANIEGIVGPTDQSIDATELGWQFFQRFALPPA